jgi:hypothetical protein
MFLAVVLSFWMRVADVPVSLITSAKVILDSFSSMSSCIAMKDDGYRNIRRAHPI